MADMVERISPELAQDHTQSGQALLVCGYDSEEKYRDNHLEGAMSFAEFEARKKSNPKDKEIIFYCA